MANEDHIKYLMLIFEKRGSAADWNSYKSKNHHIDLTKVDLSNRNLKDYNFSGVNFAAAKFFNADLSGSDFSDANLSYADMRRTNLANAFLTTANLSIANLEKANMVDTNLDFADLSNAKLCGAYCIGASMIDAKLINTNLRGTNLKFANLTGAQIINCNVEDADLTNTQIDEENYTNLVNLDKSIISKKEFKQKAEEPKKKMAVEESYDDLFSEEDCYVILGLNKDASIDDIERAYKQKAKEYHPDKVHHLGEKLKIVAQREFERIQNAYKSLTHHRSKPLVEIDTKATGVDLSKKKSTDLTIEDYLNLVKANPNNDKLYFNLGIKYMERSLIEMAIEAYKKSLQINPYNMAAQHNLKLAMLYKTLSSSKF